MMSTVEETVQQILGACRSMAGLTYDGDAVDQLEHALQCASLARCAGAARELVVAALLHDIARAPAVAGSGG
jgi:predicted HD phosphohydrolase